jgi:IPT/TIG domain-containing protein
MKKNIWGAWRRVRGLGIVRLPRVVVLAMALAISAGIPLAIPGPASAQTSDLQGLEVAAENVFIPTTVGSVSAGTVQAGFRTWYSFLWNRSQTTVTNATISVMSGYAPSLFDNVSSFPYSSTDPSPLPPDQPYAAGNLWPKYTLPQNMIHVNYSLGFDSSRTVSPAVIPVGGTQQTLTIKVTPADSRYLTTANGFVAFNIIFRSNVPGVTVVSTTNPGNLDQGEQLYTPPNTPGLFQWQLVMPQLNKTYTFAAVLNVPNATGAPFTYLPEVQIGGERQTTVADNVSGPAVTVTDPTLDGATAGSGAVTFSVAETSHTWTSTHSDTWGMFYQGTEPAASVTGVSPASGPLTGGTSVTISGSGFTGATAVDFGSTAAPAFTVNPDGSITATSPAATSVGPVDVTVTTPSGTSATSSADQFTYTYPFTGYQPPVANPPVLNQVNGGQAIPMKFSLGGNYGLNIIAPGYPTATPISCSAGTTVNSGTLTDTAGGSGLQYDSSTGTYTYVWKTSKSWAGTCQQFDLRLNDGTDHTANFQFK